MPNIWEEISANREAGARRLVAEFGNRLFAASALLCRNDSDAEELVFRTFAQAVNKIALFNPEKSFFTWLYTIMLNFRRMDLRGKRPNIVHIGTTMELPEISAESLPKLLEAADAEAIRRAVRSLAPQQAEILTMRFFNDMSLAEIAGALALPEGTVKSRLHNAKTALRVKLSETLGERRKAI